MKIIDANTGQRLLVGVPFENVDGRQVIVKVKVGLLRAMALRKVLRSAHGSAVHCDGNVQWVPLVVRYTHPGFFLQRVAFYPS